MIKLDNASLRVKKIRQSKNGPFAVATLSSEIGEFKIKDQLLDQFEEGDYRVTAWVAEIFLGQYVAYGRSVTEIRARLHDIRVESEQFSDDYDAEPDQVEPDPLDEQPPVRVGISKRTEHNEPAEPTASQAEAPTKPVTSLEILKAKLMSIGRKAQPQTSPATEDRAEDLSALFAEDLWAQIQARQPVKLDATVNRLTFRKQAAALAQDLNYKFDPTRQTFDPF